MRGVSTKPLIISFNIILIPPIILNSSFRYN